MPGVTALVVGPGAGPVLTMIQQVAGREIYRVDLHALKRKYIEETEKNLEQVFAAAERRDAVLFFDEADPLFGKRTEVKGSHDRYASLELNYLLTRIEKFAGLVVLASSMKVHIDPELRQRLRYVLDLPDIEASAQNGIASKNINAIGAVYFASMLEELKLFQVVDRLVALFAMRQLPLQKSNAAMLLRSGWQEAQMRLSETDRRNVYARAMGMPGGDEAANPNRQFNDLWIRFIAAVASVEDQGQMVKAGHDLAVNLTLHGCGMADFVASELQGQVRDLGGILSDPEVRSAFGAPDMWQVVDQVATRYLGGAANVQRYMTMAVSSSEVFDWLAKHASILLSGKACVAETDLIDASRQWMRAWLLEDAWTASLTGADEKRAPMSGAARGLQAAREILQARGLQALPD